MGRIKEFLTKEKVNIYWVLLGFYAVYSMNYLFKLIVRDSGIRFSFSIIMLPVCVATLWIVRRFIKKFTEEQDIKERQRRWLYSLVLSGIFGLSLVLGYQLQVFGYVLHGMTEKLYVLFTGFGVGVAFLPIVYAYFKWLDRRNVKKESVRLAEKTTRNAFWISWGVIFVAWIPAFLAYYPAIMSYDSNRQFQEAFQGYIWFNSHHPLVHTFLIRMFLLLGESIGSYEVGMAMFSVLQMLILSVIFAYACKMVGRLTNRKWTMAVTVAFFAFLPIHQVLAISVTKDILFTAFFLLFCILMLEFNQTDNVKAKWLLLAAMLSVGVLVMLFRNNAIYAFAIFAVFYVIWSKKERIVILLLCLAIVFGGKFGAQGIQTAMNASSGSKVEMYSVFLQSFARIGLYQNDSLDIEEYGLINRYVDAIYWDMYNPNIADGIKNNVAVSTFSNWKDDIPTMIKDWIKIGVRYPNDFLDAFLELTRGYWFIDDVSHAEVLGYGKDTNLGLLYTFNASKSTVFEGVEDKSLLPGLLKVYQKIVNGNSYYDWPVLSMLFKPAFYCWALAVVIVSLCYIKQKRKLILCLFPLMYLLTLLLGPVVNFRYVYPIMVVIPVLVAWMFSNCEWKIKDDKKSAEK